MIKFLKNLNLIVYLDLLQNRYVVFVFNKYTYINKIQFIIYFLNNRSMYIMLLLIHYWNKFWLDIIVQYLHMVKLVQEKHSQWKELTKNQVYIGTV